VYIIVEGNNPDRSAVHEAQLTPKAGMVSSMNSWANKAKGYPREWEV
jgi:hypothetical protein